MSFSGRVDRESHEGGLLISFEGRPPRLGARMRVRGGKILGKVETVLGPIESPSDSRTSPLRWNRLEGVCRFPCRDSPSGKFTEESPKGKLW
ncbi:MAG: hypothetical protein Ct9H90mP24_0820 [Methanobacteriota archaeon]|nr:MAG: hypothetical protein Ct9H90mP24_0820 [Euryarchaeota archaeon]